MQVSIKWSRGDTWAPEKSVALTPPTLHPVETGINRRPEADLQSSGLGHGRGPSCLSLSVVLSLSVPSWP